MHILFQFGPLRGGEKEIFGNENTVCRDHTVGPAPFIYIVPTYCGFQSQDLSIGKKEISASLAQTHQTLTRSQILLAKDTQGRH